MPKNTAGLNNLKDNRFGRYYRAFLAGWHARDEEVAAKDKRIEAQLYRWEVSEAKFVTTREAGIVKERGQLRAEVERLRGLIEEAFESLRLIDMQKENFPEAAAENVQRFAHDAIERLSAAGIGEGKTE